MTATTTTSTGQGLPMPPNHELHIAESPPALAADAAELFVELSQEAAAAGRVFRVALSGGSTPRLLYGLLASEAFRGDVPWDNIHFYFGDERWVPHNHRDSNYKLAHDELFRKVPVESDHIFGIPTEGGLTPGQAADQYQATLRREFNIGEREVPRFDLMFLGLGEDGHTASCFPNTSAIRERVRLVDAVYVEKLDTYRITLTPPVLQAAQVALFMITGQNKAEALRLTLYGEYDIEMCPAQVMREAKERVLWFVDEPAASGIRE